MHLGSAWNMATVFAALLVVVAIVALLRLFPVLGKRFPKTWKPDLKGAGLLLGMFLLIAADLAWLRFHPGREQEKIALLALVAVLVSAAFLRGFSTLVKNLPSMGTWSSYLKGQGLLLFIFLLGGGSAAWLSAYIGGAQSKVSEGVQFKEFKLNPAENPVYKEIDVERDSKITILAQTTAPPNGSATVAIFSDQEGAGKHEVKRLNPVENIWSRWDQENPGKRLILVVSPPIPPNISATEVHILIYLSPK